MWASLSTVAIAVSLGGGKEGEVRLVTGQISHALAPADYFSHGRNRSLADFMHATQYPYADICKP